MRTLVVTALKDEGPYILEWAAYYTAIGFSNILVFENDSTDFSDAILLRLRELGAIEYIKNKDYSGSPQMSAFQKALTLDTYRSADYVLCADCDEFIVPKDVNCIADFLIPRNNARAIAINWLNFGSSHIERWAPAMTIERFTMCAEATHTQNLMFKSLHRPSDIFASFCMHRPWPKTAIEDFVFTDGTTVDAGVQLGDAPLDVSKIPNRHASCTINHYSVRSLEEYRQKEIRGDGFFVGTGYGGRAKFLQRDTNKFQNLDIQKFIPRTIQILSQYLQDPRLARLHRETCLRHFQRA